MDDEDKRIPSIIVNKKVLTAAELIGYLQQVPPQTEVTISVDDGGESYGSFSNDFYHVGIEAGSFLNDFYLKVGSNVS